MRDRPVISIENYTIYCGDVDENKDAFYDEINVLMSKIPSQQVVIVGIDANAKTGLEQQSDVPGKWYYLAERTSDNLLGSILLTLEEQRKRKTNTLKLQLDYVLTRNISQSDIRNSRAAWDDNFNSDHRPVLLSIKIRFHKMKRGVSFQPKIDMADLKDEEFRTNFRQRVSTYVGVVTRRKLCDADSFFKVHLGRCKGTLPVQMPRKKFAFASTETKSTYNSVCVARSTGHFNQEKRLKTKFCLLDAASGKAVGEATPPTWRDHFKTLLNRQAPSAPELEPVHRPTYAINEEPATESEILVCIQKMEMEHLVESTGLEQKC
ncbi:hypothetical protein RB195_015877 [Necator americanus]|uniref:Endonuclease/exonuclease/phosphatase domain-containing protein n=1 Tax=Necator americanus TaxID=51031 RepID=A0ABR1E8H7_NECAM